MRTYIFTPREREAINGFLEGKVEWNDVIFRRLRVRMRTFNDLAADVELYLGLRRRLAKAEATAST